MNVSHTLDTNFYRLNHALSSNEDKTTPSISTVHAEDTIESQVNISAAGTRASAIPPGLEALRLPSWSGDFSSEYHNLSYSAAAIEETKSYVQMSDKLVSDGHVSNRDRQAIQAYLSNSMSVTQQRKDVEAFYHKHQAEFSEYEALHKSYVDEAMQEYGIVSTNDYQEKILNVEGDNQSLRYNIMEKMLNDPRVLELMDTLKIDRPG